MMKFSQKQTFLRGPATPGTSGGRPRAAPEILKTPTNYESAAGEARMLSIAKKAGLILLVCVFAAGGALIGSYLGSVWDKKAARQHRSPSIPLTPPQQQPDFAFSGPAATTSGTTPEAAQEEQEEGLTDQFEKADDSPEAKEAFQEEVEGLPDDDEALAEAEVLEDDGFWEEETPIADDDDAPTQADEEDLENVDSVVEILEKEAALEREEGLPEYDTPESQIREDEFDSLEEETLADDDAPEAAEALEENLLEKEDLEGEGLPEYDDAPQAEVLEDGSREEEAPIVDDNNAPTVEDLEGKAPVEESAATPEQQEAPASHVEHPSGPWAHLESFWEEQQETRRVRLEYQENSRRFARARAALKKHHFEEAHELLMGMAGLDFSREIHHWAPAGNFHNGEFHADLGVTLVNAGLFQEALKVLAKGLRGAAGSPPKAFCLNALAIVYRNLGDLQSAVQALRTAVQVAPKNAKAWTNLGVLAMELGDLQQADDAFYYAAEALGPKAGEDDFLVRNVQALQNQARGLPSGEPGTLELWYENDEPEA